MGSFAWLVSRLALLCFVPVFLWTAGFEPGSSVSLLSAAACALEVALALVEDEKPGRSRKVNKSMRPAHYFPLEVGILYCLQLWATMLASSPDGSVPAIPASAVTVERPSSLASLVAVDKPRQDVFLGQTAGVTSGSHRAEGDVVDKETDDLPEARYVPGKVFDLDAPLAKLKWNPKTISVVLPCAEEREYALKTVEAFWKETPADVLHEIVVVDDGSNPPLSETHLKPDVQKKYKVNIQRHEHTVGLIGAKKTGGDAASGDIVAFFDCHVGPQPGWHKDFLRLIGQNYRRMVVPQITALDVDTWKQVGSNDGMSKCYVTWDGDFKWGGPNDMYMGMLSGGLAGMSKRWWTESGGYDSQMLGWGGENIDQGVRMWVCGGEMVAAPNAHVAHMWRTGSAKTQARYHHVGDTTKNRARAIHAWFGEFAQKLYDFENFASREKGGGDKWYGDMSHYDEVKKRLNGCRPFAWYLRRFSKVYEDAGIIPTEIFMIREMKSGKCLLFQGRAGTSGSGRESVVLATCDSSNDRFFWHLGNVDRKTTKCCSGLRAWNTEQCFEGAPQGGKAATGICSIDGVHGGQAWSLDGEGLLRQANRCVGTSESGGLKDGPCLSFRSSGGGRFEKHEKRVPIERKLYVQAQKDNPGMFARLNEQMGVENRQAAANAGPEKCREPGVCVALFVADITRRCMNDEGQLVTDVSSCVPLLLDEEQVKQAADPSKCLDTWSDDDVETWGFYTCHDGDNQKFEMDGPSRLCTTGEPEACFQTHNWPVPA